jgi:hypothetical protein
LLLSWLAIDRLECNVMVITDKGGSVRFDGMV